jgi:hypothetical protein
MGTMTFQLPSGLAGDAAACLERTCVAGAPDNMPWATQVRLRANQLVVSHHMDDNGSGYLVVPWALPGFGQLMGTSATLMERPAPYNLLLELARGKVNQVRCQANDWQAMGIPFSAEVQEQVNQLSILFGRAAISEPGEEATRHAQAALTRAYEVADHLVQAYVQQVFRIRQEVTPQLESDLSCRLSPAIPAPPLAAALRQSFNTVCLPLSWSQIEAEETVYNWKAYDAVLDWALAQGFQVTAGPLVDFSSSQLPAWLWMWENDVGSLAAFMCRFVETAVRRYANRIRQWQLTAASNCAALLGLSEDELLGLTGRLVELVRQIDPSLELSIGIAQPWGEYMATTNRTHSPYLFADTLIRYGVSIAALDVEIVMGMTPRGSYCRDLLEASRLLDLYTLLQVPLRVTLGYPSSAAADPEADPELTIASGHWGEGFTPEVQGRWAAAFAALALSKTRVRSVQWAHFLDAEPHQFRHAGLVDAHGKVKPALHALRGLREKYLR